MSVDRKYLSKALFDMSIFEKIEKKLAFQLLESTLYLRSKCTV